MESIPFQRKRDVIKFQIDSTVYTGCPVYRATLYRASVCRKENLMENIFTNF